MFALSLGIHLAAFLIIAKSQLLPAFHPDETPVTYVDMVTLPVVSPQSGTPAPAAKAPPVPTQAAPTPAPPPAPAEMALPQEKKPAQRAKTQEPLPPRERNRKQAEKPEAEAHAFEERMAKLERQADAKRQSDVLERLRNRGSRVGMPGAQGSEAGSDYSSYLSSRLRDAFAVAMASQSKSPQVIATISVGPDGRIACKVEKSSGDPLFDDAVARAVTIAGRSLKPPPGGGSYKRLFRFRPEGINAK